MQAQKKTMNEIMNKGIAMEDWEYDIKKVFFKQANNLDTFCRNSSKKEEEELHSFFESFLKGKHFRGIYLGQAVVGKLGEHRDLISLHRKFKYLEQILIRSQRIMHCNLLDKWYGVTHGHRTNAPKMYGALVSETYMWVELDQNLAIGLHYFRIEHLEFRQTEFIFKLKVLETIHEWGDEKPFFIRVNQQKSSPETKASPSGDTHLTQQKSSPETNASPSGVTLPKRKKSSRKKKGSSGVTQLKQQNFSPKTNASPSRDTLLNQQEASLETNASPSRDTLLNQPEASPKPKASPSGVEDENERPPFMENTSERDENVEREIHLEDFIQLTRQWGPAIKRTIYDFMANDINKENIKAALRYLGILCISLALATLSGIKFLCFFVLEFMSQVIRLMQILIPLILKLIDVLIKIVGVFCTLIAMMWRILRLFINMCFSTYIILDICIIFAFYFLYYYLK